MRVAEPISEIDISLKEYHGIFARRSARHAALIEGVKTP
jgi:hypothetical protein